MSTKRNTTTKTQMDALDVEKLVLKGKGFALNTIKSLARTSKKQENQPNFWKVKIETEQRLMLCGVK